MGELHYKDQVIAQLRAEIATRDAALDDIRNLTGRIVAAIHGRISGSLFPKEAGEHAQSAEANQTDRPDIE